jgi:RecB family exonuclease
VVVAFGGVSVDAKVDRIDALGGGAHAVLDYKTGAAAVRSWLPPRPDEPQLPMYALTVPMRVDALAFARVRPGELAFAGLARAGDLLPDVPAVDKHRAAKSIGSWDALKEVWRAELEALGSEFASGVACVRPKNGAATCRQCDQQVLCRIDEKRPQVEATLPGSERDE